MIAIDPGTTHSGLVIYSRNGTVTTSLVLENKDVFAEIRAYSNLPVAIEMIASYGMAVGKEVFVTCLWIGRFIQCAGADRVGLVYRKDVKLHLCGSPRAKDANVRQAIIDLYGGKAAAVGNKKQPGPLYHVKSHAWSALAVAITATQTEG